LIDDDGHRTEVAGIIAANPPAGSGIGFQGIAPDATIVSIRQTSTNYQAIDPNDPNTQGRTAGTLLTLAQAIVHAANRVPHGGINISGALLWSANVSAAGELLRVIVLAAG
jgi:membrane-anchored mycosin MYCP